MKAGRRGLLTAFVTTALISSEQSLKIFPTYPLSCKRPTLMQMPRNVPADPVLALRRRQQTRRLVEMLRVIAWISSLVGLATIALLLLLGLK